MRRRSSSFIRAVALATVFCALSIAAGCGRETFDLLPDQSLVSAGSAAGVRNQSGSAGLGGNAAGSGKAGGGSAGKAELGGFGGRGSTFPGGGDNCLGDGGCSDEPPTCLPASPFCATCDPIDTKHPCPFFDASTCDPDLKLCVECRNNSQCGFGERCNPKTLRCAKACGPGKDNCSADGLHLFCNSELALCVTCLKDGDCNNYGPFPGRCYMNACVECFESSQCSGQTACVLGRCIPR